MRGGPPYLSFSFHLFYRLSNREHSGPPRLLWKNSCIQNLIRNAGLLTPIPCRVLGCLEGPPEDIVVRKVVQMVKAKNPNHRRLYHLLAPGMWIAVDRGFGDHPTLFQRIICAGGMSHIRQRDRC